ncbi:MAG: hypothetical protein L6N96_06540, partial [Candidatus Methylarchaceae archaeon HK02M2]|nr:hypothetical protein [Candidatus Methylarchaceae archaeon HK02M2]
GVHNLCQYLEEFQKFELTLYGTISNYRDHLVHVFRVLLLGIHLVRESFGFDAVVISKELSGDVVISKEEKEAMWCIIALTHDLGYSLEGIHQINQGVRNILQKLGIVSVQELVYSYFTQFGNISDFALRFMSSDLVKTNERLEKNNGENNISFAVHIQPKFYQKFMSAQSNFDHGVISSIILMKDLVFFKESDFMMDQYKLLDNDDARQFLIRRDIIRAIASHSWQDIYYLTITNFPFLITVFDEMQEWGRPRLVDVTKRGDTKSELTINEFSNKIIDYEVRFFFPGDHHPPETEIISAGNEIKKYFVSKCKKWLNVLRSAVGGKYRDLRLKFTTIDNTTEIVIEYWLIHETPDNVKISPNVKNEIYS